MDQIEKYKTIEPVVDIWKHLRNVCIKRVATIEEDTSKKKKRNVNELLTIFRDKWLFYASYSPIWKERIVNHKGKIDKRKKTVIFLDEDMEECFYDKYNYEPDEQPIEIQKYCLGL